ncbi:peptidylprolyl isomerase [Oscillochloris sp. ZM17-4]|uniref:peptidylprolyl isomerase n=1 Tax=Oscillochloris sp. ZM17-4 TaxID=2866714 RepID=UPI001C72C81F|nr:peptidylprolyl isomerase [Oscillochloris sp. ZM17-4]MBX0328895.1 peptidylprolyl isomerase [Oscillochloris sp. ZM17-4]
MVRRFAWALGALILTIALAGCQSTANGVALQVTPDNPQIFRVGGDVYTSADFSSRLQLEIGAGVENLLAQGQTREEIQQLVEQQNIRGGIFDRMVQDALLLQYARSHGIGVDPAAVDSAVLAQGGPADGGAALRLGQAQSQLALEVLARNTRADMFHARVIQLASEADADAVLADLQAGNDFTDLATARSQDPVSAAKGGDLGWLPKGDSPAELDSAGFSLALNTPAKLQVGSVWQVVEVLERQAGPTAAEKRPFDSFAQLQSSQGGQQFYQETFLPWYDQLRQDAETSGDLVIAQGFDPNSVPIPFPEQ